MADLREARHLDPGWAHCAPFFIFLLCSIFPAFEYGVRSDETHMEIACVYKLLRKCYWIALVQMN